MPTQFIKPDYKMLNDAMPEHLEERLIALVDGNPKLTTPLVLMTDVKMIINAALFVTTSDNAIMIRNRDGINLATIFAVQYGSR